MNARIACSVPGHTSTPVTRVLRADPVLGQFAVHDPRNGSRRRMHPQCARCSAPPARIAESYSQVSHGEGIPSSGSKLLTGPRACMPWVRQSHAT